MPAISVNLPEELQDFVASKIENGTFADANEYIIALISSARDGQSEIESALLEGIASGPAVEWTDSEWAETKERIKKNHNKGY